MIWFTAFRSKEEYLKHYEDQIAQYEALTAGNTLEMYQL